VLIRRRPSLIFANARANTCRLEALQSAARSSQLPRILLDDCQADRLSLKNCVPTPAFWGKSCLMTGSRKIRNIALIGFMGTGKSSVGRLIADQLHYSFVDTDEMIETHSGKSVSAIFAEDGEAAFRKQEQAMVAELASRNDLVISTGGGVGADQNNLTSLKEHALVVCLWASPEKIWERVRSQTHRPLLREADPLAKIRQLLAAREQSYKQADVLLNTEVRSLREVAQQVLHQFRVMRTANGE
jgi:shikimate kinase